MIHLYTLKYIIGTPDAKLTPTIVTRWYRAPELCLGARIYDVGVDIWAIGCVFAELFLRDPFFPAMSDIEQYKYIVSTLGTPIDDDWIVSFIYYI